MKTFTLLREYKDVSTIGWLYDPDDTYIADTIERPKDHIDHPCVPEGTYPLTRYYSPDHGFNVPLINNVPGRSFCEIHPANKMEQLLGCVAPGVYVNDDFISNSKEYFESIMNIMNPIWDSGEEIQLIIKERPIN